MIYAYVIVKYVTYFQIYYNALFVIFEKAAQFEIVVCRKL